VSFVSVAFVILLAIVLAVRLSPWGRDKLSPVYLNVLLIASLVFYAWHIPIYLGILLTSITVDYVAGIVIENAPAGSRQRRRLLILSILVNLGLLGVFKYGNFAAAQAVWFYPAARNWVVDLVLPMGISFYTFASMSYTIDVYRGVQRAVRNYPRFMLFVCFFPHLVAGPIVRATAFVYQLPRRRRVSWRVWSQAIYLIILGLFLKLVVADNIAQYLVTQGAWDRAYRPDANATLSTIVAFLFSAQIFGDFAGYSSVAIGIAYLLGFKFPVNFNAPYIAASFSEFWRRWHITLSQWLRDYLYVPLGGNRKGRVRTYINLALVMVLGGLWHGAAWTFVIWGTIHGAALALERLFGLSSAAAPGPVPHARWAAMTAGRTAWFLVVQIVIVIAWVFFRSPDLASALAFLRPIAEGRFEPVRVDTGSELHFALLMLVPIVILHLRVWLAERGGLPRVGYHEKALAAGLMLYAILTLHGRLSSFIYFQF
jgi:alginate O-acetyltransferase complex protein AlgI